MAEYEYRIFMHKVELDPVGGTPQYLWSFKLSSDDRAESCQHTGFALPTAVSITVGVSEWADMPFTLRKGVARALSGAFLRRDILNLSYFRWVEVNPRPGEWQCKSCGKWIPRVGRPFCSLKCVDMW